MNTGTEALGEIVYARPHCSAPRRSACRAVSKAAVDAKDAGKLKAAYAAYTKNAGIDLSPTKESVMGGQGFGSDYDWKNRTPKGTVYQR